MSDLKPGIGGHVLPIKEVIQSCYLWIGKAITPIGQTHVADILTIGVDSFSIASGANDWGDWTQLLGSQDTPIDSQKKYFFVSAIYAATIEKESTYILSIVAGENPNSPDKRMTMPLKPISKTNAGVFECHGFFNSVGAKIWARCICPGQGSATINFYIGISETEVI